MNILILNGSPRMKGNTRTALAAIAAGIAAHLPAAKVDVLDVAKMQLKACVHCDACRKNGGNCVLPGENAAIIQKIADADSIIFGSPVYWWGISAHLKMAMDSMYSKDEAFQSMKKKIGLVTVGAAETTDPEYRIIHDQFTCICEFLGWELRFSEAFSTPEKDTMAGNAAQLAHLKTLWEKLQ